MANIPKLYKICVKQLPWTISKHELKAYFTQYGHVKEAEVEFDKKTGLSKSYGHVVFIDKVTYDTVLQIPIHKLDGCPVVIKSEKTETDDN